MEEQNNGGFQQRQMHQGNWKCSKCGCDITQLPFKPDPSREDQLLCLECHREKMANRPQRNFQRQMFQGNWKCSKCGKEITELPFRPHPDRVNNLMCLDCFRGQGQN